MELIFGVSIKLQTEKGYIDSKHTKEQKQSIRVLVPEYELMLFHENLFILLELSFTYSKFLDMYATQ